MQAHNLTYAERARFAYNAGNTETEHLVSKSNSNQSKHLNSNT